MPPARLMLGSKTRYCFPAWAKTLLCFILLLSNLARISSAWTSQDHELFRIHDEVRVTENQDFYGFLGVKRTATREKINAAYRKKSLKLHPDKARQNFIATYKANHPGSAPKPRELRNFNKKAQERFARLGIVASILRGPGRDRYDYFLNYGFPKWRGTEYYYVRFRPGLVTVLIGLFVFGGGPMHYGAMLLSWKRKKDFFESSIREAQKMAWGDYAGVASLLPNAGESSGVSSSISPGNTSTDPGAPPVAITRNQKRLQEKQTRKVDKQKSRNPQTKSGISGSSNSMPTATPTGPKKKVLSPNGKTLIVYQSGPVYLEDEDENGALHECLIDPDSLTRPVFGDTLLMRLPHAMIRTGEKFTSLLPRSQPAGQQILPSPILGRTPMRTEKTPTQDDAPNSSTSFDERQASF